MPSADTTRLKVNGRDVDVAGDPQRTLLEILREDLALTGTKYGCGEGACGACSVIVDGQRVFSCTTAVGDVAGKSIRTIEGLATGDALHPVQQAFCDANAFQCGYCTSGMIMATVALLDAKPNATDDDLREGLNGHLCRCCGYVSIEQALKRAAELSRR